MEKPSESPASAFPRFPAVRTKWTGFKLVSRSRVTLVSFVVTISFYCVPPEVHNLDYVLLVPRNNKTGQICKMKKMQEIGIA